MKVKLLTKAIIETEKGAELCEIGDVIDVTKEVVEILGDGCEVIKASKKSKASE